MKIIEFLKSQATIGLKFWIGVALILVMLFFLSILYEIAQQQIILNQHFEKTKAIILSSEIVTWRGGFGKYAGYRYKPKIEYSFIIDGHQYKSNTVTMINPNHTDQKWAEKIVNEFRPGTTVTAYYNPEKPQKSFLIYEIAFWPYCYAMYSLVLMYICAAIYFAVRKIYHKPDVLVNTSESYYLIRPTNVKNTFQKTIVFSFLYYSGGLILGSAYFYRVNKPYELIPIVTFIIYFVLGLIPLIYYGYLSWQSRDLQPPQIFIDRPQLKAGENINIKVIQKFKKEVELANAQMALICTTYYESIDKRGNDCIRNQDIQIYNAIICKQRYFQPNEKLEYEDSLLLPPNIHKSGFSGKDEKFPFYRWYFEITNRKCNGLEFITKYFVNCE